MPCLAIHLAIAKKYCERHPYEDNESFIKGSLAPDISNDKVKSHYGSNYQTVDIIEYMKKKVDLSKFLNENDLNSSFNKGYFLHLICDYEFFGKYITDETLKGKTTEEINKKGYQDYNIITPILMKKYNICIPTYLTEKYKAMLCCTDTGKLTLISLDVVESFIEEMSQVDLEKYAKKYIK